MRKLLMGAAALALVAALPQHARAADAVVATPSKAVSMVLLPKFLGILPFDLAHQGAEEAAKELNNPTPLQYLGPTPQWRRPARPSAWCSCPNSLGFCRSIWRIRGPRRPPRS